MPIYLSTNSNGTNTEGIGAMAQYQLHTYALSKIFNINFTFSPFINLQHYQYHNVTQKQFCDDINSFFNFPDHLKNKDYDSINCYVYEIEEKIKYYKNTNENIVFNVNDFQIMSFCDQFVEQIKDSKILLDIKNNLFISEEKKYFSKKLDTNNICFHIRKRTQTDNDDSQIREYYNSESQEKINNLINQINNKFKNKKNVFHIYSQGKESEFDFLYTKLNNANIVLHIEEYPINSLYHMINCDILIMANSSFSYISHLIGDSILFVRNNFYHKTYSKNKYLFDAKGNIL